MPEKEICEWCQEKPVVVVVTVATERRIDSAYLCKSCADDVIISWRGIFDAKSHQRPGNM